MKTLLIAGTTVALLAAANLAPATAQATKPVSQVVQWNRTLLVIVRTPGAQPATIHPTRSSLLTLSERSRSSNSEWPRPKMAGKCLVRSRSCAAGGPE
jgi:hypothetical protein